MLPRRHRIALSFYRFMPAALILLAIILPALPWRLGLVQVVAPSLAMLAAAYWLLHAPHLLPPATLIVLALLHDVVTGLPVGVSIASWLALRWLVRAVRVEVREAAFVVRWAAMAIAVALALVIEWAMVCLLSQALLPVGAPLVRLIASVLCYPPMAMVMEACQRVFVKKYWYALRA